MGSCDTHHLVLPALFHRNNILCLNHWGRHFIIGQPEFLHWLLAPHLGQFYLRFPWRVRSLDVFILSHLWSTSCHPFNTDIPSCPSQASAPPSMRHLQSTHPQSCDSVYHFSEIDWNLVISRFYFFHRALPVSLPTELFTQLSLNSSTTSSNGIGYLFNSAHLLIGPFSAMVHRHS